MNKDEKLPAVGAASLNASLGTVYLLVIFPLEQNHLICKKGGYKE